MPQQAKNEESSEPFREVIVSSPSTPTVNALQDAVDELIAAPSADTDLNVDVSMDGDWCILEGTVDSQGTRAAIFSLIPGIDGKRYIVDRLQVTYE